MPDPSATGAYSLYHHSPEAEEAAAQDVVIPGSSGHGVDDEEIDDEEIGDGDSAANHPGDQPPA